MQLSKLNREIISRATMGVVAAGLLYGGVKCLLVARALAQEWSASRAGRSSGATLPLLLGIALVIVGAVFALAAVTPSAVFGRIMGPPGNTTLWENRDRDGRWS